MNSPENEKDKSPENLEIPIEKELFWRDEILQVIFWYCGEGLGKAIGLVELQTFLPAPGRVLGQVLEHMVTDGYLVKDPGSTSETRYAFTPFGSREGARRFADEFAGLTDQAHGECNDPECDCQTLGPAACSTRVTAGSGTGHNH
ncbi:MAG: hypothetical protein JWP00_3868 [Chloroflexi bacterium]|jgi:hypothetical protein|nr:hypothetical protein [Chloroflexota bacterium]